MKTKKPTSVRMSDEAKRLWRKLSDKLQVSQAAVMELAIRRLAKEEGVE